MTMAKSLISTSNSLSKRINQEKIFSYHYQLLVSACLWLSSPQLGLNAAEQGSTQNAFSLFNGHSYQIITTPKSWSEAEEYAASIGGRLLVINSFQENVFIEKLMSNYGQVAPDGGGAEYHWLGASDSINENNWAWADGSTLETSKIAGRAFWGDGAGHGIGGSEPDNFNNQDCLAMAVTAWPAANPGFYGAAGQWNDIDCDNKLNFIVEYPIDATYSDGQLNAENINVGDKKYRAELRLIKCASFCFQVSSATEIQNGSQLSINDVSGDILRLRRGKCRINIL